jgi:hypothetical protein
MDQASEDDHIIAPQGGHPDDEHDARPGQVTEFSEFPGYPHFPGALGSEQVADYALRWAVEHAVMPGDGENHD